MTYTEAGLVDAIERASGRPFSTLTQQQRDVLDQFHAGGAEAVERLLPTLRAEPGMTVLDVGSGLGGPARQVAARVGCHVVGVDLAPGYVEAARALTEAAGLGDRVRFACADVTALAPTQFDAAYTMHVQMNVADKSAFFAAIAQRLPPGARLATFEVCRTGAAEPVLPLPWSLDGTDSHLAGPDELRDVIAASGFDVVEWVDETPWILEWFRELAGRVSAGTATPGLPAILNQGPARMVNFARALADTVVSVQRGAFIRLGGADRPVD